MMSRICSPWVEPEDLSCWDSPPSGVDLAEWQAQLEAYLTLATGQLSTISGIGVCEITEIPCRDTRICCGCSCVGRCDICGRPSALELRAPVVELLEVLIDGAARPLNDFALKGEDNRWLYRLDAEWPNVLRLDPPTVVVKYRFGVEPTETDIHVLSALVCAWASPKNSCTPPVGTTSISRRGITWQTSGAKGRKKIVEGYGLPLVDAWITTITAANELDDSSWLVTLPESSRSDNIIWHTE